MKSAPKNKKYVLVIPDGAGDLHRTARGLSPLAVAATPYVDWLAAAGVCGLMQTLYPDLPQGSVVAQMGMLGWDPYAYAAQGRSAWELHALRGVELGAEDLVFRANFVRMEGRRLASYNAHHILSERAVPLVERLNQRLGEGFPGLVLYHNSDFRNSLVVRQTCSEPQLFTCPEPHESEGMDFDLGCLIDGGDEPSRSIAGMINRYLLCAAELLQGEQANALFAWSAAKTVALPSFRDHTGYEGRVGIVGAMEFLQGIAKLGGISFFRVGNGRPDTDYRGKGAKVLELLDAGYSFVICHVNGPDEAAHMQDVEGKVRCLEAIDRDIVGPVVEYFKACPEALGGVMVAPDHYTNSFTSSCAGLRRVEAHSLHPVPFVLWNGRDRDGVVRFHEDAAQEGRYGSSPISHLELLGLLGVGRREAARPRSPRRAGAVPSGLGTW